MDSSDSEFENLDDPSSLLFSDTETQDESQEANRSYLRGVVDMGRQVTFRFETN